MGARGPQAKPSHLRVLEGNPSGRPFNPAEAKVPLVKELPHPEWFDLIRRQKWAEVCRELASMNGLSSVDYQMLVLYVDSLGDLDRLMKKCQSLSDSVIPITGYDKTGKEITKGVKGLAWHSQLMNQKRLALLFATHFGQTPSARARIVFLGSDGSSQRKDPFEVD